MSTLISFFHKLAPGPKRRLSMQAGAVGTFALAICLLVSPRVTAAQCQSGDAKFTVNIVQLVPTEETITAALGLIKASREGIEQQVGLLQSSEVMSRIAALNKAFRPAAICFEWDGQLKSIPFDQLHINNSLSRFHYNDPILSPFYGKFTSGNRVLRLLILPEMDELRFGQGIAGECARLNIAGVSPTDIPGWVREPNVPDICFMRRFVFADRKGAVNNDYAVVHEVGHWLGLGEAFNRDSYGLTEQAFNETKERMRLEDTAETECKKLNPVPKIGYDGSTDTPVQPAPAGCDAAFSCTRGNDGHLKKVPRGNPMDYGFEQARCELSNFSPGQIAILKKGAQYRQRN
jgi:hypothetical protein